MPCIASPSFVNICIIITASVTVTPATIGARNIAKNFMLVIVSPRISSISSLTSWTSFKYLEIITIELAAVLTLFLADWIIVCIIEWINLEG